MEKSFMIVEDGMTPREVALMEALGDIIVASGFLAPHVKNLTGPDVLNVAQDIAGWLRSIQK